MFVTTVCRAYPWPFLKTKEILANKSEDARLQVLADEQGRFVVKYDTKHGSTELTTQRVAIADDGIFIISAGVKSDELTVIIDDTTLLSYEASAGAIFEIRTSKKQVVIPATYPSISPELGKSESEEFFLRTLLEVQKLAASQDPYERLRLSGLLRLLLLDTPCLIDIVNRNHQLNLEYTPVDARIGPQLASGNQLYITSIYRPGAPSEQRPSRSRGSFIQVPVAYSAESIITVQDVILANANKQGGIHYDPSEPNKPGQRISLKLDTAIELDGLKLSASILKDIALVMLDAIAPLVLTISKS